MPRPLTIVPTPYKSSYLAIPPSPFSPRLPISPLKPPPPPSRPHLHTATTHLQYPPPAEPLNWLWQCHKCKRAYRLGVTRRCLDDGHFFCAGTTTVARRAAGGSKRSAGKVVRHRACASEFDYVGWQAWGSWRRWVAVQMEKAAASAAAAERIAEVEDGRAGSQEQGDGEMRKNDDTATRRKEMKKDCWARCDYPSECRWGKEYGVPTPVSPHFAIISPLQVATGASHDPSSPAEDEATDHEAQPKTTFDDILLAIAGLEASDSPGPLDVAGLMGASYGRDDVGTTTEGDTRLPSAEQLVQSARRRRQKSQSGLPLIPSPLAANPSSMEMESK